MTDQEAIVSWLRKQARIVSNGKRWFTPIKNRTLSTMAGSFDGAARVIERDIHWAQSFGEEMEILRASVDRSPEGGNHEDGCHAKHESAVAESETPDG